MSLWLVSAGRYGEQEEAALQNMVETIRTRIVPLRLAS
jgi:hypothetical protein